MSEHVKSWRWERHRVKARTKSEARSQLKKTLGLKRLPVGANVSLDVKGHQR